MKEDPDFALCNGKWRAITDRYGDSAKATDFSEDERTVVLVWTVLGIVDNGGFRYLISSELPGDPQYKDPRGFTDFPDIPGQSLNPIFDAEQ